MADCTCADPTAVVEALGKVEDKINRRGEDIRQQIQLHEETMYGSAHEGQHGMIDVVRFCRWAAPEVSGAGHTAWAIAYKAAALAVGALNAGYQSQIADMKNELADKWASHAEEKWDRFNDTYLPKEKELAVIVQSYDKKEIDCDGAMSRANEATEAAFASGFDYISRKARAMNMCIDDSLMRYGRQIQADTLVDCTNYNLRDDIWWTDIYNDIIWNRRSAVIELGRNLPSEALKYGDIANALMSHVGAQISTITGDVVSALGYFGARNDTFSPLTFLAGNPIGNSSQPLVSPQMGQQATWGP